MNKNSNNASKKTGFIKWLPFVLGGIAAFAAAIAIAVSGGGRKQDDVDRPIEIFSEPNVRISENTRASDDFIKNCTLEKLTQEAEAVALVRIGNWLGENAELGVSLFAAEVKDVIKGELGAKVTILQQGCSRSTVENHPIFTGGNDLLLFLVKAEERYQNNANDVYRIVSGSQSVFYTTLITRGSDRFAVTLDPDWLTRMPHDIPNMANVDEMWKEVFSALAVNDKLWNNMSVPVRMVYSYELIKAEIRSHL